MSIQTHQQTVNFIWSICNLLRGPYKRNEYRKVILPLTILQRFDCILESTKAKVLVEFDKLKGKSENIISAQLKTVTGVLFYNLSKLTFKKLLDDPNQIAPNLNSYINAFSPHVRQIFEKLEFGIQVTKMSEKNLLFNVVKKFASDEVDLSPANIDNLQMGYVFEELLRIGAEQSNEEAGEHFTPREVIKLMVNLLLSPETDLRKSHVVKTIYDPPYNTGNDFVYRDNFTARREDFEEEAGVFDEDGDRLFKNTETNGRFHSDWCSMIYPRLVLARNLLADDGVIFISIDDCELDSLKKICDEVIGANNYIGNISRMMKSGGNKGQYFSPNIEYILVYAKNRLSLGYFRENISDETASVSYNNIETEGEKKGEKYSIKGLCQPGLGIRPNQRYWIKCPDGSFVIPRGKNFPNIIADGEKILPTGDDTCWKWIYDRYIREKEKGNIVFKPSSSATALVDSNGNVAKWNVFNKIWLKDREDAGRVPVNFISKWENRISSQELKELNIPFDFAKPSLLLKYLINIVEGNEDAIVLDFFSGSATTAHAVMQLNAEDGGKRKFIMVQLPEVCAEGTEAAKTGYANICEIGKERIRLAGEKIKTEAGLTAQNLDIGFRVLKLDDTNMNDVYYAAGDYTQDLVLAMESNIKSDRTDLDLLYGCLLDWGLPLSMPHAHEKIDGFNVHTYNDGDLITCFEERISEKAIREIARRKPLRAVFRDSGFTSSPEKINVFEVFKLLAPNTNVRVI